MTSKPEKIICPKLEEVASQTTFMDCSLGPLKGLKTLPYIYYQEILKISTGHKRKRNYSQITDYI